MKNASRGIEKPCPHCGALVIKFSDHECKEGVHNYLQVADPIKEGEILYRKTENECMVCLGHPHLGKACFNCKGTKKVETYTAVKSQLPKQEGAANEALELLEKASYRLSQAVDIFNGSSGLNTGNEDKYLRMVDLCDEIQEFLKSPKQQGMRFVNPKLQERFENVSPEIKQQMTIQEAKGGISAEDILNKYLRNDEDYNQAQVIKAMKEYASQSSHSNRGMELLREWVADKIYIAKRSIGNGAIVESEVYTCVLEQIETLQKEHKEILNSIIKEGEGINIEKIRQTISWYFINDYSGKLPEYFKKEQGLLDDIQKLIPVTFPLDREELLRWVEKEVVFMEGTIGQNYVPYYKLKEKLLSLPAPQKETDAVEFAQMLIDGKAYFTTDGCKAFKIPFDPETNKQYNAKEIIEKLFRKDTSK